MNFFRDHKLFIILILAIILRLGALVIIDPTDLSSGDFPIFDRMAKNLLIYGDFHGEPAATQGSPNINPGFALWLAFIYFFFGSSPVVFYVAQIALGISIVLGSYLLAREIFNRKTGLIAAFIVALFPPLILITIETNKTLLYSAFFLFSVFFFWLAIEKNKYRYPVLAGAFLGFAALNESIIFYTPLVFGLWLLGLAISVKIRHQSAGIREFIKKAIITFSLLVISFSLVLAPWVYRNIKVAPAANDQVRILSKSEFQLAAPRNLQRIGQKFISTGILISGAKQMFLSPYGTWWLNRLAVEDTISYKKLPINILKGERYTLNTLGILTLKILVFVSYWALFALALYSAFKFRRLGTLVLLLLAYIVTAAIGFVALNENIYHLSVFIVPLFALFAVLASGLFTDRSSQFTVHSS